VGLRGLELRANHAVAIEPISGPYQIRLHLNPNIAATAAQLEPQSQSTPDFLDLAQMSLNCRRTPRKDWQSAAKGAVLSEIPGA
jgi:hypothetical protein